jgi:hypothetical protein
MKQNVPHPKNSAHYWTGSGMSVNRVMNGTTKKNKTHKDKRGLIALKLTKDAIGLDI